MSEIQDAPPRPRAMALRALVLSIILAGLYSALGHWIPYIVFPITLLVCAGLFLPMIYGDTSTRLLARVLWALLGGGIGVVLLWGVWYGLEFSWSALKELTKLAPSDIVARIVLLSDQIVYTSSSDTGVVTHGTAITKAVWLAETILFGATPLIGAIMGPKTIDAFRRYGEAYNARRGQ